MPKSREKRELLLDLPTLSGWPLTLWTEGGVAEWQRGRETLWPASSLQWIVQPPLPSTEVDSGSEVPVNQEWIFGKNIGKPLKSGFECSLTWNLVSKDNHSSYLAQNALPSLTSSPQLARTHYFMIRLWKTEALLGFLQKSVDLVESTEAGQSNLRLDPLQ